MISGLASGVLLAGIMNPWDRALYLSVRDVKPFLTKSNFEKPFLGFWQAITQRTIQGGLYFVLQGELHSRLAPTLVSSGYSLTQTQCAIGLIAGTINGMLVNQLASVKYHVWNDRSSLSFIEAARQMYKAGGMPVFFNGMVCTGLRDMIFGVVYEMVRVQEDKLFNKNKQTIENDPKAKKPSGFLANLVAGSMACIASSPYNYVRTIKFSYPPGEPAPSTSKILRDLVRETRELPTVSESLWYAQQRLRLGWGTARVGVGMAFGQLIFDATRWELGKLKDKTATAPE